MTFAVSTTQNGCDNQADEARQLDEDVHGWTRGVLEGVTHGVAGHGCLVGVRTFVGHLAVDFHASLKGLLGIVPRTSSVVLEDGPKHTAHGHTGHVATEGFSSPCCFCAQHEGQQADDQGEEDRHGAWEHHFLQCSLGGDVHALAVFRSARAFQDSRNLFELAPDFLHHFHGGLSNAVHGQGGEHNGHHATDEQCGKHVGLEDVDAFNACELDVRCKQSQGCQCRRGDGEAFADGGRGVSDRVENVGALTNFFREFAHLRDATGIVRDGAEGINRELHGRGGHHGASGDCHPVEAGKLVGCVNGRSEEKDGAKRRNHACRETCDDVGRGTRRRLLDNVEDGLLAEAGVVLCHVGNRTAHHETDDHRVEDVHGAEGAGIFTKELHGELLREHRVHQEEACDGCQDDGPPVATVQGRLHLGFLGVVIHANHLRAENREHDAEGRNHKGQQDGGHASKVVGDAATHVADHVVAENHGSQHGGDVRTEEVCTHAGHVTHVVAHVVGDGGGVAGIVLRNAFV